MEISNNVTEDLIKKAAKSLKDGHLVAFPTETVYGLGADSNNQIAVNRIYEVKNRPSNHPLIVHISSINQIHKWAKNIPEAAINLANDFWPGALTLVLERSDLAKGYITGNQEFVGLRVPAHPMATKLIKEFEKLGGNGVVAPSANKFGAVSPTYAQAVLEEIGTSMDSLDLVLDDGFCKIGIESTIIDCTKSVPVILRDGFITHEHISQLLNINSKIEGENIIKHSGNFQSHYAPKARILINQTPNEGEGLVALSSIKTPEGVIRLCSPNNNEEYAHQLYSSLRKADNLGLKAISVFLPDGTGIGKSIIDRINKAAAKVFNFTE
jgi:L-threonylcarbamoyladenylate synthase